jgi:hypothetical protein
VSRRGTSLTCRERLVIRGLRGVRAEGRLSEGLIHGLSCVVDRLGGNSGPPARAGGMAKATRIPKPKPDAEDAASTPLHPTSYQSGRPVEVGLTDGPTCNCATPVGLSDATPARRRR